MKIPNQWLQSLLIAWMIGLSSSTVWASLVDLTDLNKTKDPSGRPGYYDAYKEQTKRELQSRYQFLLDHTGAVQEEEIEVLEIERVRGEQEDE